jgi:hypothetical protein
MSTVLRWWSRRPAAVKRAAKGIAVTAGAFVGVIVATALLALYDLPLWLLFVVPTTALSSAWH